MCLLLGNVVESSVWHKTHHWYRADFGCDRKEGLESWGSLTPYSNSKAYLIQEWTWQTNTDHSHPLPPASASIPWEAAALYPQGKARGWRDFSLVQEVYNVLELGKKHWRIEKFSWLLVSIPISAKQGQTTSGRTWRLWSTESTQSKSKM